MPDLTESALDAWIHTSLAASAVGQVVVGLWWVGMAGAVPRPIP